MHCHACNDSVEIAAGEGLGFRDECPGCRCDLHVCLNCRHHDPAAYNECRESSAERVADRDRANRCEYFLPAQPAAPGGAGARAGGSAARADLEALFKKS